MLKMSVTQKTQYEDINVTFLVQQSHNKFQPAYLLNKCKASYGTTSLYDAKVKSDIR